MVQWLVQVTTLGTGGESQATMLGTGGESLRIQASRFLLKSTFHSVVLWIGEKILSGKKKICKTLLICAPSPSGFESVEESVGTKWNQGRDCICRGVASWKLAISASLEMGPREIQVEVQRGIK